MTSFESLIASRKDWLENVLRPWCRDATLRDLKKAEDEWLDIAGKVATEMTLWTWCWERFPVLVHDGLTGVNETTPVEITLKSGESCTGYPDGRASQKGSLVILTESEGQQGPFTIDQIESVRSMASPTA